MWQSCRGGTHRLPGCPGAARPVDNTRAPTRYGRVVNIRINIDFDDEGSLNVQGNSLTPAMVETVMTALAGLGTATEEYEEEE